MCLAIPGRILSIDGEDPLLRSGRVSFAGAIRTVNLACVPEAKPGDYVVVHAGMALSVLDEAEALATLRELEALGDAEAPPAEPAAP